MSGLQDLELLSNDEIERGTKLARENIARLKAHRAKRLSQHISAVQENTVRSLIDDELSTGGRRHTDS